MADPLAIETIDLRKEYGRVEALRGLNLHVPAGSIFGFLGRNGAGKTTAMTVAAMIRFTAAFYPTWRSDLERRYVRSFDLPADRTVRALSRGMRTKLALLLALCRGAELLVLDEPTSGLDPAMTEEILQALVRHVASEEMTVFFSSHQIAEVDQIADRVAIVDRGRAVVTGELESLREDYRRIQLVFDGEAPQAVFRAPGAVRV
ncbi:MAG: ABC transporter ATP-binding protein, partial [Myxococcota bacterium]